MPYAKHTLLVNNPVKYERLSMSMQTGTLLTTTSQALQNDPDFWADTASLPPKEWYFKMIAANVDATTVSFGLALEVQVKYDVIFKQWKDEAPSKFGPMVRASKN